MSFINYIELCQRICSDFLNGMPDVLSMFTATIKDSMSDLQFFFDIPLIGGPLEDLVSSFLDSTIGDYSYLYMMIGVGLPSVIVYSFVKWCVGIINGG